MSCAIATSVPSTTTNVMNVAAPPSSAFVVRRAGYSWDMPGLEEVTACNVTSTTAEGMMLNNCDLMGGASGAPTSPTAAAARRRSWA